MITVIQRQPVDSSYPNRVHVCPNQDAYQPAPVTFRLKYFLDTCIKVFFKSIQIFLKFETFLK